MRWSELGDPIERLPRRVRPVGTGLKRTLQRFNNERGFESAAALSFYGLFSLFPLLVMLISGMSFVFEGEAAQRQVFRTIFRFVPPNAHPLIRENIVSILDSRGTMSIAGVVGLLWAASGVFNGLARNLERAWPHARARNLFKRRAIAVAAVIGLFVLLGLLFVLQSMIAYLINAIRLPTLIPRISEGGVLAVSSAAVYLFAALAVSSLYRWTPRKKMRWRSAVVGGLFAVTAGQVFTYLFGWYLAAGLGRYNLVYGSLSSILVFMFWMFCMNTVLLFGGHLGTQFDRHSRKVHRVRARRGR